MRRNFSSDFDKSFNRTFKFAFVGIIFGWVFGWAVSLGVLGFVGWVVYKLLEYNGVI